MTANHWTERPLAGLDTETTSADPKLARILQAALIDEPSAENRAGTDRQWLINPQCEIPAEASAIHGITKETVAHALTSAERIPYIGGLLASYGLKGTPLVIFNVPYDWVVMNCELDRCGVDSELRTLEPMFIDPLVIDRALDKYRKGSRKLVDVARFYGVELRGAHGALADAKAAVATARAMIKKYKLLREKSLEDLQEIQRQWYAEWAAHLQEYWRKIGKMEQIDNREWPGT